MIANAVIESAAVVEQNNRIICPLKYLCIWYFVIAEYDLVYNVKTFRNAILRPMAMCVAVNPAITVLCVFEFHCCLCRRN